MIQTFPYMMFAYMFQPNLPPVYRDLRRKSPHRMRIVTLWSVGISSMIYITTGIFGYLTIVGTPGEAILSSTEDLLMLDYK